MRASKPLSVQPLLHQSHKAVDGALAVLLRRQEKMAGKERCRLRAIFLSVMFLVTVHGSWPSLVKSPKKNR